MKVTALPADHSFERRVRRGRESKFNALVLELGAIGRRSKHSRARVGQRNLRGVPNGSFRPIADTKSTWNAGRMRWISLVAACMQLAACGDALPTAREVGSAQATSKLGPISGWELDAAVNGAQLQQMRDRAYVFCLSKRPVDKDCLSEQDWSLFEYANAFRKVRGFRSEANPTFPFAKGFQLNPSAFDRSRRYCSSVYEDSGSRDARSLGPCMSAATGGDFFGVVPVP